MGQQRVGRRVQTVGEGDCNGFECESFWDLLYVEGLGIRESSKRLNGFLVYHYVFTCQGWRDVRVAGGHREVAMGQAAVWVTGLDRGHINNNKKSVPS